MKYKLERVSGQPVSDEEILEDLKKCANQFEDGKLTIKKYKEIGKYNDTTVSRRFGTWNNALKVADVSFNNEIYISEEKLFENILNLWEYYGRQPRRSELAFSPSQISQSPYNRIFGSWTNALESFIKYINETGQELEIVSISKSKTHKTSRDPSLRLRWKVLKRDNFTCRSCGLSPIKNTGIELHVDHIIPWSKGGETVEENLQTLCNKCNLGKSNTEES